MMKPLEYNTDKKEIYLNDLGVTFRTTLAVAARGHAETGCRRWFLVYKGVRIGQVRVKDDMTTKPKKSVVQSTTQVVP